MRLLAVAAHPDDETQGAGGTLAWHAARGDTVWACVLADGASSRHGRVEQQADCARTAAGVLGLDRLVLVGLPDQRLDTLSLLDVITPIERAVKQLQPDVVLTHFPGDVDEDHRLVGRATLVATTYRGGQRGPIPRATSLNLPSPTLDSSPRSPPLRNACTLLPCRFSLSPSGSRRQPELGRGACSSSGRSSAISLMSSTSSSNL